jgi:hypothetical protein
MPSTGGARLHQPLHSTQRFMTGASSPRDSTNASSCLSIDTGCVDCDIQQPLPSARRVQRFDCPTGVRIARYGWPRRQATASTSRTKRAPRLRLMARLSFEIGPSTANTNLAGVYDGLRSQQGHGKSWNRLRPRNDSSVASCHPSGSECGDRSTRLPNRRCLFERRLNYAAVPEV